MKPLACIALALLLVAGCNKPADVNVTVVPASQATPAAASQRVPIIMPAPAASVPGEAQRQQGAQLAAQGANGAAPCTSCHGAQGEGNPAAGFPRIAGQSYDYLRRQLSSYANDSRNHPVMAPIAKALSPAQQEAAAAYYASIAGTAAAASASASAAASAVNSRGRQLAGIGDELKGVQACANCHGPQGIGQGAAYPYLAGQAAAYLVSSLTAWRDGTRRNDPSGQMPQIAKSLADADIQAVASFYAQMPPPAVPRDADLARSGAMASGSVPAVVSGPRGAEAQGQGVGSEQGAPITGGGQGPGGDGATGSNSSSGSPAASAASR